MKDLAGLVLCFLLTPSFFAQAGARPLMRDFMGLNRHFQFKPELYKANCRVVRNDHSLNWDVDPANVTALPAFPLARNKVHWDKHVSGKCEIYEVGGTPIYLFMKWIASVSMVHAAWEQSRVPAGDGA